MKRKRKTTTIEYIATAFQVYYFDKIENSSFSTMKQSLPVPK